MTYLVPALVAVAIFLIVLAAVLLDRQTRREGEQ